MTTAIKVHEFAEAGAGLAPAPVPAAGALFRQQPRPLQRGFDVRIRQREAGLAPRDVMKGTGVEAGGVPPVELEKAPTFPRRALCAATAARAGDRASRRSRRAQSASASAADCAVYTR